MVESFSEKKPKDTSEFDARLSLLRRELDEITTKLIELIKQRMLIIEKIATLKKEFNMPVEDSSREAEIMDRIERLVEQENRKLGTSLIDYKTVQKIMELLISDAKRLMHKVRSE